MMVLEFLFLHLMGVLGQVALVLARVRYLVVVGVVVDPVVVLAVVVKLRVVVVVRMLY